MSATTDTGLGGASEAAASARAEGVLSELRLARLVPFLAAAFQFGLLILLIRAFDIESRAFLHVAVLAWCGFVVQHFLAERHRLPFFACLSLASIVLVFGAANGAWLIATGFVLIGVLHVPLAFPGRVALAVVAGAALWVIRAGWVETPLPQVVLPILASMFMFRWIVYAYDLKHRAAPFSLWHATSYFFLLPNVCFPLFPVVDYKTFCRSHGADDDMVGYQRGIVWMLRGCVHLVLYRMIYQNLAVDPAAVDSGLEAVQLVVTTFLIYLKVSGSFHLIAGLLQMFRFHLPRTNQNWLLASSFTDLWRRINIYWKEFIQKIFFNPVYFPLRKRVGDTWAVVGGAVVAFLATWFLHSYQWFWIRGSMPIKWQDTLFWALLGVVVTANMVWEAQRGRRRSLKRVERTWRDELGLALRTVGIFTFLCLSWSLWTTESRTELGIVWSHLLGMSAREAALVLLGLVALGVGSVVARRTRMEESAAVRRKREATPAWFWRTAVAVSAVTLVLVGVGTRPETLAFAPQLAGLVDHATENKLNAVDARRLERGYYEDLVDVGRFDGQLSSLYARQPKDWRGTEPTTRTTGGFPPYELIPSQALRYKGALQSTNSFGMRDREYAQLPPPGTTRIALLGSSHTKGSGVEDDQTFENLVEDRLAADGAGAVEILNFSVGGYGPLSRLAILEDRVAAFEPGIVLYIGIDDVTWIVTELANAAEKRHPIPFEHVREVTRAAGVEPGMPSVAAEHRLRPHAEALLAWAYGEFVRRARAADMRPLAMILPRPEDVPGQDALMAKQMALLREAGFEVLDMAGAYVPTGEWAELWVAPWDKHPNVLGHRMVAEKLYEQLQPRIAGAAQARREGGDRGGAVEEPFARE